MKKEKNTVCVDCLYQPKRNGFNFYIIDRGLENPETYVYFLDDNLVYKHNLKLQDTVDLIRDYCWRYGIEMGMYYITNYLSTE